MIRVLALTVLGLFLVGCAEEDPVVTQNTPFACGSSTCEVGQFCEEYTGGACLLIDPDDPSLGCEASSSKTCMDSPAECNDCSCMPQVESGECTCTRDEETRGITLMCFGA